LAGHVNATDESLKQVMDLEAEAVKRIGPGRSDIDREVDLEIWTWYQDRQTAGSKPSWREVSVCTVLLAVSLRRMLLTAVKGNHRVLQYSF
jgi:hypothetical protein